MLSRQRVFLDTSFIIALSNVRDPFHSKARVLDKQLSEERVALILHSGILLEIGDGFAKPERRERGMQILQGILSDESYSVVDSTEELLQEAIALYAARCDKAWGLTDCVSFAVMKRLNITEALTADAHFVQAGFTAMLL